MSQTARQAVGRDGERLARAYLERHGYEIEAANVRGRRGELDLVARDGPALCFIEVRAVSGGAFGPAAASIDQRKRLRILRAARAYLQVRRPRWEGVVRCDVVAIDAAGTRAPSVTLIRNAFDASAGSPAWW